MKATVLKNVKIGDYFTFKPIDEPNPCQVYVRGCYDRISKKYEYTKFTDVNDSHFAKSDKVVYVDFIF